MEIRCVEGMCGLKVVGSEKNLWYVHKVQLYCMFSAVHGMGNRRESRNENVNLEVEEWEKKLNSDANVLLR